VKREKREKDEKKEVKDFLKKTLNNVDSELIQ
jgi:hypothetical protein